MNKNSGTLAWKWQKYLGYDFERGRQDRSPHPFTTSFSINDVRITTRFMSDYFPAGFFATIHETGHALYDQGISKNLERTLLAGGASLGVHESQSRMWENLIGRGLPFWKFLMPRAQFFFPEQLRNVDAVKMYRAVNRVQPSLIRVEADEITYNLHIMLRFELENMLLEKRLDVKTCLMRGIPRCGSTSASRHRMTRRACCRTSIGHTAVSVTFQRTRWVISSRHNYSNNAKRRSGTGGIP